MKYKVKIIETYAYYVEVDTNSKKEALQKIKTQYENADEKLDGVCVADATTLEGTKFKIGIDR